MLDPYRNGSFSVHRLLIVGTGALGVTFLPYWLNWLRLTHPHVETRTVVTKGAQRFVTRTALSAVAGHETLTDTWDRPGDAPQDALHVELAQWPEAIAVYPCSMHYLGRLALGLTESPSLLALQCTKAFIGVAPAVPPGGIESVAFQQHASAVRKQPRLTVASPRPAPSSASEHAPGFAAAPFPELLERIEAMVSEEDPNP